MRRMNSDCVDLIYLDPPFNSKTNYAAPIGSHAAGAEFKDTWTLYDIDIVWLDLLEAKHPALNRVIHATLTKSDKSYLIYMAIRLLEMRRILKPAGGIYLHCDPTMSHYLKLVMDAIFGRENFRNEIIWAYTGPGSPNMRQFNRKHDVIFWYSNGEDWTFNGDAVRVLHKKPIGAGGTSTKWLKEKEDLAEKYKGGKIPETWWTRFSPVGRIKGERTGYPTQKPRKLLKRIIEASSPRGGIVFDPFCGCATTCIAAEELNRQWIGIDISPKAAELVQTRILNELGFAGREHQIIHRQDIPQRTDLGEIPKYNCKENKNRLYGEQGGHCNGCREHFQMRHLEVDHIIARSQGGTDHIENLQMLCGNCNQIKGNRGHEYLLARMEGRKVPYA